MSEKIVIELSGTAKCEIEAIRRAIESVAAVGTGLVPVHDRIAKAFERIAATQERLATISEKSQEMAKGLITSQKEALEALKKEAEL